MIKIPSDPTIGLNHHYKEVINSNGIPWEQVKEFVIEMGKEGDDTTPIPFEEDPFFSLELLQEFYNDPDSVFVFLEENHKIIGMEFAINAENIPDSEIPEKALTDLRAKKTAYAYLNVVKKSHRGTKENMPLLVRALDEELRKKGYERKALHATGELVENGARKYNNGRIVQEIPQETQYGKQTFFIVNLS